MLRCSRPEGQMRLGCHVVVLIWLWIVAETVCPVELRKVLIGDKRVVQVRSQERLCLVRMNIPTGFSSFSCPVVFSWLPMQNWKRGGRSVAPLTARGVQGGGATLLVNQCRALG